MNKTPPARPNVLVLKQILNPIPRGMINRLALETGVDAKASTFSVLSHLSAMLFAQLSHAMGLNDVCGSVWKASSKNWPSRASVTARSTP